MIRRAFPPFFIFQQPHARSACDNVFGSMRLINTNTLELREFFGATPRYAILSHTWEEEEVSLQEMKDRAPSLATKKGYRKIVDYCHLAARQGYAWVWVDTCCINKTSDAELSESINSMFRWYENAAVCHVFLSDLPVDADLHQALPRCRWFTRGWTLQELIAPQKLEFYDQGWAVRGTKDDLVGELSAITKIDPSALRGEYRRFRIGARISWAANRETTRPEDIAYCLLGLLDINMPMLYGEGQRAFRRLQEEIIRKSNDLSIFAWDEDAAEVTGFTGYSYSFLLAQSPRQFAIHHESPGLLPSNRPPSDWQPEYAITNNGLRIRTKLQLLLHVPEPGTNKERSTDDGEEDGMEGRPQYFLPLAEAYSTYGRRRSSRGKIPGIILDKIGPNFFERRQGPLHVATHGSILRDTAPVEFYVQMGDNNTGGMDHVYYSICEGSVEVHSTQPNSNIPNAMIRVNKAIPESLWDHARRVFLQPSNYRHVCAFSFNLTLGEENIPLLCVFRASRGSWQALLSDPGKNREVYRWFCKTKSATEDTFWNDWIDLEVGYRCLHLTVAGITYSVMAHVGRRSGHRWLDFVREYVITFKFLTHSETGCEVDKCDVVRVS